MILLYFFAFISGLVTILAPCIWPLLPIVLSTSIGGGHKKSLGITLGILLSFGILNLGLSFFVKLFGINPDILRLIAVIILITLGIMMIVPKLSSIFEAYISSLISKLNGRQTSNRNGFGGGFLTGLSLGVVWTPCAGPILAAIATLTATSNFSFEILLLTFFYLIGVGIPLFFFSYGGARLISKSRLLNQYTGRIQQIFGVILVITALGIATGYDKVVQAKILDTLPEYSNFITNFERNDIVKEQIQQLKNGDGKNVIEQISEIGKTQAPEFVGITKWLNSQPLTMKELRGSVVLIDFWTYTCINCIRTLPYITSWYEKYKDKGLVIVGIHSPEFEFEKSTANVEAAIQRFNITYPVAQDNDFRTWNAYANQYWPAKYLIDAEGKVRKTHFGEGDYEEMEKAIQELLAEKGTKTDVELVTQKDTIPRMRISPETYLGSNRMEYYYPNRNLQNSTDTYTHAANLPLNSFSLGGTWTISDEYAQSNAGSSLYYRFFASNVFLVMKPSLTNQASVIRIYLDNKALGTITNTDVVNGRVQIDTDRLYHLINLDDFEEHILRIDFEGKVEAYAFTFG